jgi:hypothetical protein
MTPFSTIKELLGESPSLASSYYRSLVKKKKKKQFGIGTETGRKINSIEFEDPEMNPHTYSQSSSGKIQHFKKKKKRY